MVRLRGHYKNRLATKSSRTAPLGETAVRLTRSGRFGMLGTHEGGAMNAEAEEEHAARKRSIFDWIVLLGMVVNLVIAVFMILYYFDLL
jgi:hypothetical protein